MRDLQVIEEMYINDIVVTVYPVTLEAFACSNLKRGLLNYFRSWAKLNVVVCLLGLI